MWDFGQITTSQKITFWSENQSCFPPFFPFSSICSGLEKMFSLQRSSSLTFFDPLSKIPVKIHIPGQKNLLQYLKSKKCKVPKYWFLLGPFTFPTFWYWLPVAIYFDRFSGEGHLPSGPPRRGWLVEPGWHRAH